MKLIKIIFIFFLIYLFKRLMDLFKTVRELKEERSKNMHESLSKGSVHSNNKSIIDADYRIIDH